MPRRNGSSFLLLGFILLSACSKKPPTSVPAPVVGDAAPAQPPLERPARGGAAPDATGELGVERRRVLEERIHFEFDRWSLTADARALLEAKAQVLRAAPQLQVRIEGHADDRGSDEYNLVLSQKRAAEARRYLLQLGIDARRLETVGFGEEHPLQSGENEAAWAMNRRAEFRIIGGE
jgi:peptidoglycan-associated lipoprotein